MTPCNKILTKHAKEVITLKTKG